MNIPTHCTLCPRRCGADRTKTQGLCGGGSRVKAARAALHFWEEPCNRLMDFDDQMVFTYRIFRQYPDILAYYQRRWPYLCVDESQDTSKNSARHPPPFGL